MEVSITAVSANRKMTKTLVRASGALERLRTVFSHIDTTGASFDILQFVLIDRSAGFTHLESPHGSDRIMQVHIGAADLPCGPGQENAFAADLIRAIVSTLDLLPISQSAISDMKAAFKRANTEPDTPANSLGLGRLP